MKKHHAIGALAAFIAAILMFSLAFGQGAQFDFLLNQQRNSSTSLAGGTATFYVAGSVNTPKAIYSDIGLTTLAANPYTLNAAGKAQVYGSGLYKIVVKDSAGVIQYTYDNVAINFMGGFVASQTPTSGEIPVLGANRELKIKNGATSRDAIRDKGLSGILFGSMDYATAWLMAFGDANIGAGYDPYGVSATNSAWMKLTATGAIVTRVSTNAGASFSTYSSWTSGQGANKVNGFMAYSTAGAGRIAVSSSTGKLAPAWMPSGVVIQSSLVTSNAATAITAVIPQDDTIPQKTEGTEVLTTSFTPKLSNSVLRVDVLINGTLNASGDVTAAVFIGTAADAVTAGSATVASNGYVGVIPLVYQYSPGTTSAQTIAVRVGPTSGTFTLNGRTASRIFGGVQIITLKITEITG